MTKQNKAGSSHEFPKDPKTLVCYVDGSYNHSIPKYAFGCVFLLPDGELLTESGNGNQPASLALRNVTGEMLGAMFAVRFAIKNAFTQIEIRYDYEGIEKWVTGAWKSKTDLTQKYAKAMRSWGTQIQISFRKVTAHTNVYYNEMADKLAKAALLGADGIPEIRTIAQMREVE
jgi:ribonuclease HI